MVKPKVINEVAVLIQDISVLSWESNVRSKENLVLTSSATAASSDNSGDVAFVWLAMRIPLSTDSDQQSVISCQSYMQIVIGDQSSVIRNQLSGN